MRAPRPSCSPTPPSSPRPNGTAVWLDQLTAAGALTPDQRARIAAEDGAASLARVLRRAELAGHDPRRTLVDAIGEAPLTGAKNTTNVLYSRITDGGNRRFDPVGSTHAEWVPRTDSPEWNDYLAALAAAADQRAAELGRAAAHEAPEWAVAALGPVPADLVERAAWQERAGVVAAYRELRGHDDQADALGQAPKAGQVEQYAAYRAAWRALGRPEVDRAIYEKSDGQLRMWVRAWQREQAWGPRYVGHELAGTRQAAAHQHQTAALRRAEADAATDPAEQARLQRESAEAAALAATLDRRAEQLQELDDARAVWLVHTAVTRVNAEEAEAVLAERHANDVEPEPVVTADEWLVAHRGAVVDEERDRAITEDDLADDAEPDQLDQAAGGASRHSRDRRGRTPRRSRRTSYVCRRPKRSRAPSFARSGRWSRSTPARCTSSRPRPTNEPPSSPAGMTTTTPPNRRPSTSPSSSTASSRDGSASRNGAGRRDGPRALAAPRPPQRRPDALTPPRLMLHQIGPSDVELLRGQVLRLDQLLDRPHLPPCRRRRCGRPTAHLVLNHCPGQPPARHRHPSREPVRIGAPGLRAVEPLCVSPHRAELVQRHAEVSRGHACEQ